MKKRISILLILALMFSMFPYVSAENEDLNIGEGTPATPVPTPVATAAVEYTYTQGDTTVIENVTVTESDLSGSVKDSDSAKEYETVIEKTKKSDTSDSVTTTEYDIAITGGEGIITQKTDSETIQTIVEDSEVVVENENISGCSHVWELIGDIQQATSTSCGIRKYQCSNEGCTAVMYEEIPMLTENAEQTSEEVPSKVSGEIISSDGNNPKYSFENNILTISGSGSLPDYKATITESNSVKTDIPVTEATPWASFANKIIEVIIENGIKRIGDFVFANLLNLQQVDIYSKDVTIGDYAFAGDEKLSNVNFLDKKATPTFENDDSVVTYTGDDGNKKTDSGSTAFAGDGNVNVNYSCVNPNKTEMKTNQKFSISNVGNTDLHLNCSVIPGYAPTETEYGRTDGLYCNDCKQTITAQQVIYPNGKAETGKYNIIDFSALKDVPKSLEGTKYDTLEKVAELQEEITDALAKEFNEEFKTDLKSSNCEIYDIELVDTNQKSTEDVYVVNIPYPTGTQPYTDDFIAVGLNKDDEIEEIDTFLTNKGIQIEVETLKPVGVAWNKK